MDLGNWQRRRPTSPIIGSVPPPHPTLVTRGSFRESASAEQFATLISVVLLVAALVGVGLAMHDLAEHEREPDRVVYVVERRLWA